jgi:hypothetical protein
MTIKVEIDVHMKTVYMKREEMSIFKTKTCTRGLWCRLMCAHGGGR